MISKYYSLRKNLKFSIWDGVFYSLMVGFGESYFAAFVLAYGYSEIISGLIISIPLIGGSMLQLLTPKFLDKIGPYKRWTIGGSLIQGLCSIPLAVVAFSSHVSVYLIFFLITIYQGAGMAIGSTWNAWMRSLLPTPVHLGFFSRRTIYTNIAVLVGLMGSGVFLEIARSKGHHQELLMFGKLFLLCTLFRFLSAFFLSRQSVGKESYSHLRLSIRQSLLTLKKSDIGFIILILLLFRFTVAISSPYFAPYMIVHLKLSYWNYMGILAMSFVGKMSVMLVVSRSIRNFGMEKILFSSILGISIIPLIWMLFSISIWPIYIIEFLSGSLWGVFDLTLFLIIFSKIKEEAQTSTITVINFFTNLSIVLGTTLGGYLLLHLGSNSFDRLALGKTLSEIILFLAKIEFGQLKDLLKIMPYWSLFFISTLLRLIPVFLFGFFILKNRSFHEVNDSLREEND